MNKEDLKPFYEEANNASGVDELWEVIAKLKGPLHQGKITNADEAAWASHMTMLLSRGDSEGQDFLRHALQWAAAVSLNTFDEPQSNGRFEIQLAREKIGPWLGKVAWPLRSELTLGLISLALKALSGESWKQACWLLSSIGRRTPAIEKRLWQITKSDNSLFGDMAFGTLLDLGIPPQLRSRYLGEAHRRFKKRPTRSNHFAIYQLGDTSSLSLIARKQAWASDEEEKLFWLFLAPTIGHIADLNESERVNSRAIVLLQKLFRENPTRMESSIYFGGKVLSSCNSRRTITFLLQLITEEIGKESKHKLSLLLHRIEQCVKPNQVKALSFGPQRKALQGLFRSSFQESSDYKGRALTFEADVKSRLWSLSLNLANPDTFQLGAEFLRADQSPFTHYAILDDLACFSFSPLPPQIVQWATESESEAIRSGDQAIERMSAIRVVWSAATEEAFEALLRSQYTTSGKTLADSSNGLTYLAVELSRDPKKTNGIVEALFKVLDGEPSGPQPGSVSQALEALSRLKNLSAEHYAKLSSYILEEPAWTAEDAVRSFLVGAFEETPSNVLSNNLQRKFESWAESPDHYLSTSCFVTLIKQGLFLDLPERLHQRLGLYKDGETWELRLDEKKDLNGGVYSLLVERYRVRFETVFTELLSTCPFRALLEAMETLKRLRSKSDIRFAPEWTRALVERAKTRNTRYNAEPYLFECLRENAPMALAAESWEGQMSEWSAESREALAHWLGTLQDKLKEIPYEAIRSLNALQADTHFGVRRAAFRSLGRINPSLLGTIIETLAKAQSPKSRRTACEAAYWMPQEKREDWWVKLWELLEQDEAKDVREAAKDAKESARKLVWAKTYAEALMAPIQNGNEDILERWKYATAIAHVGDDESARNLRDHLREVTMPAHAQRFLIQTVESLDKNWDKCRKKWPEPLFPARGALSSGNGTIEINSVPTPIRYVVWQSIDALDPQLTSWTGTGKTNKNLSTTGLLGTESKFIDESGKSSSVYIQSIDYPNTLSFLGGQAASD